MRGFLNSSAENSMFDYIDAIDIDNDGNIYVASNNVIRKLTPDGLVSTFAGTGKQGDAIGKKEESEFNLPADITFDFEENIFVADRFNNKIKKITKDGNVSEISFPDSELDKISDPRGIYFSRDKRTYVNFNNILYEILPDYKLKLISNMPSIREIIINKESGEFYFELLTRDGGVSDKLGLIKRNNNGNYEDITDNYTKSPYPNSEFDRITFDNTGKMYISYENGDISVASKEGIYLKTFSTFHFQFLLFSINHLRIGTENDITSMAIDDTRKILYYSNFYSIYKIKLN
jgi:hypothetical protein